MSVDSTPTLKTFAAVWTLVVEGSQVASSVIAECPHVLENLLAQFAGQRVNIKV